MPDASISSPGCKSGSPLMGTLGWLGSEVRSFSKAVLVSVTSSMTLGPRPCRSVYDTQARKLQQKPRENAVLNGGPGQGTCFKCHGPILVLSQFPDTPCLYAAPSAAPLTPQRSSNHPNVGNTYPYMECLGFVL